MRYDQLAEIYDAENEDHAMLQEDVPFFLGQLPARKLSILELACGTGRATLPIAQAGHRVLGVDFDPRMIDIARRKAALVGLPPKRLRFQVADALNLHLEEHFDFVVLLFNTFMSFSTLAQLDACLSGVVRHLKPNGRFFLDILQPNIGLLGDDESRDLEPHFFFAPSLGVSVLKTIDVKRDVTRQVEHVTFHYRWHDAAGRPRHRIMKFDMTFIFPRELELLLNRHGLVLECLWGNYDGSALRPNSPRMLARAKLPPIKGSIP